jgi:fructose-1,6-bisphosphatase II
VRARRLRTSVTPPMQVKGSLPLERIPRDRTPSLELVRITEAAAIAASHWMGHGDNNAADQAAVEAMRRSMEDARFNGRIVIGEGERDEAPMLFIGERVGRGDGPEVDIAVDPLEGTNPTAKGRPNAVAVMAFSEPGGLLHAPDTYMEKLAVGAPAKGKVDLDRPVAENLRIIAESLNRDVNDLTVIILDRPRHEKLIAEVRRAGARIKLIEDGDLMGALSVAIAGTSVHALMGIGAAPEGVLAAAALRCVGGELLGRLKFRNDEERARARKMGVVDEERIYRTEDLASGNDIRFVATGVTDGDVLRGVHFFARGAATHSILLDRLMGKLRFIDTTHFEDIDHPPLIRLE